MYGFYFSPFRFLYINLQSCIKYACPEFFPCPDLWGEIIGFFPSQVWGGCESLTIVSPWDRPRNDKCYFCLLTQCQKEKQWVLSPFNYLFSSALWRCIQIWFLYLEQNEKIQWPFGGLFIFDWKLLPLVTSSELLLLRPILLWFFSVVLWWDSLILSCYKWDKDECNLYLRSFRRKRREICTSTMIQTHAHILCYLIPAINIIYIDIIYYNNDCLIIKYYSCFICMSHDICIIHLNFLLPQ